MNKELYGKKALSNFNWCTILYSILFLFLLMAEIFGSSFLTWDLNSSRMKYFKDQANQKNEIAAFYIDANVEEDKWDSYNKFGVQNASYFNQSNRSINNYEEETICFMFTEKFKSDKLYNELGVLSVNEQFGWDTLSGNSVFISQTLSKRLFGSDFIVDFSDKFFTVDGFQFKVGGLYYSKQNSSRLIGDYYRQYLGETIFINKNYFFEPLLKKDKICISFLSSNTNYKKSYDSAKNIYNFDDANATYLQPEIDAKMKSLSDYKNSAIRLILYFILIPFIAISIIFKYKKLYAWFYPDTILKLVLFVFVSVIAPFLIVLFFKNILLPWLPIYWICESSLLIIFINIMISVYLIQIIIKNIPKTHIEESLYFEVKI